MSPLHDDILKFALSLPEADRITLATELLDSVEGTRPGMSVDAPCLADELDRRFDDGSPPIAWEIVRQQLDDDLKL